LDFSIAMYFLASREYPVIDYQTMAVSIGDERLFRAPNGAFWLYMSSHGQSDPEERIIRLTVRDAIFWLNEAPEHFGSFWHFAKAAPASRQSSSKELPSRKSLPRQTVAKSFGPRIGRAAVGEKKC
jgi:hypothetical protein